MKKRFLAMFLALAMCLALLPAAALAADSDFTIENGVLTKYNGSGRAVTIPDSVTSIGPTAFMECRYLTSVTIPDSVVSIENSAFYNCFELASVTIPDSVTSIGMNAFHSCDRLTSVTIPCNVTTIGHGLFADCSSLTSIQVSAGNSAYTSIDGVLFTKDEKTLVAYPVGRQGAYTIPNSVTTIFNDAFWGGAGLTNVTIPNSVTSIRSSAFLDTGLTSITIPDSVTEINGGALHGGDNLASIQVDPSNPAYTSIDGVLFSKDGKTLVTCPRGKNGAYTVPNGVTEIGSVAFSLCEGMTRVTIPSGVTSIGWAAFSSCKGLTSVTISSSVTTIDESAFNACTGLTDVYYGGNETQWKAINIKKSNDPLINATIHFGQTSSSVDPILNDDAVFIKQTSGKTCTLATATMMVRRRAILDGISSWDSITETSMKAVAWGSKGFIETFQYRGITGGTESIRKFDNQENGLAEKKKYLISLLQQHPEGIGVYSYMSKSQRHAILLTDYDATTDTFYCADPARGAKSGRIPLDQCYITWGGKGQAGVLSALHRIYYVAQDVNRKTLVSSRISSHCPIDMVFSIDGKVLDSRSILRTSENSFASMTVSGTDGDRTIEVQITGDHLNNYDTDVKLIGTGVGQMAFTVEHLYSDGSIERNTFDRVPVTKTFTAETIGCYSQSSVVLSISDSSEEKVWVANPNETATSPYTNFDDIEDTDDDFITESVHPGTSDSVTFTDVPANSWYYDAVYWAVDKDIVSGTSPTTFTPNRTCTTTEIVTLLWHAAGRPASTAQLPFALNARLGFAEGALRWAYEEGIIDAAFDQTAPCTRAGAAKFLWQAFGSPATAAANSFTDVPAGAGYAPAVAWAAGRGIIKGTSSTTFTPDTTCTRAEIVTLLYRAYK